MSTEQQAPEEPYPDEDGHCIRYVVKQRAPGLDWDAASRKMIEQAQEARGTPDHYWMIWYEDYDRRPELYTLEEAARARYQAALTNWSCHLFCSADQLAAAQAEIRGTDFWKTIAAVREELASSQHGYQLLADQAEKQAGEIAALKARLNTSARVCTEAFEEIFELRQKLADMTEDYLRRHKDAADRSEEVLTLRIEIAALKQRLEQSEKALRMAKTQMAIGRRFLPSHGSFGEEGISAYCLAQNRIDAALAAEPPGGQQEQGK